VQAARVSAVSATTAAKPDGLKRDMMVPHDR
jgi:hypothetical protein